MAKRPKLRERPARPASCRIIRHRPEWPRLGREDCVQGLILIIPVRGWIAKEPHQDQVTSRVLPRGNAESCLFSPGTQRQIGEAGWAPHA